MGQVVFVTTVDEHDRPNVAPKSWISMTAFGPPPVLMFGCNLRHRTARHALATEEFVVNVPGRDLVASAWAVGADSSAEGAERFRRHGLTPRPSLRLRPPRIEECVAHLECVLDGSRAWGEEVAIFGRIVAASVDARMLEGSVSERYREMAPFFFAEPGWAAALGPLESVAGRPKREGDPDSTEQTGGAPSSAEPRANLAELTAKLRDQGVDLPVDVRLGWFGDDPEMAERLGRLVRSGVKTATTGLLWEYEAEGEAIPEAGEVEILVNWDGEVLAVKETISVAVTAFDEVDADYAAAEGEGDRSLEHWRRTHWEFFSRICRQLNREPERSMPVVCERFRLRYVPPDVD